MATLSATDAQLLQIVSEAAPASIQDVISIMQKIDALLPNNDGLKWFNKLYPMVTQQIDRLIRRLHLAVGRMPHG
jgi:hypothetical protein